MKNNNEMTDKKQSFLTALMTLTSYKNVDKKYNLFCQLQYEMKIKKEISNEKCLGNYFDLLY